MVKIENNQNILFDITRLSDNNNNEGTKDILKDIINEYNKGSEIFLICTIKTKDEKFMLLQASNQNVITSIDSILNIRMRLNESMINTLKLIQEKENDYKG